MVDVRKMAGFALGLFGTFLAWQTGIAIAQYFHAGGAEHLTSLLFDPENSLRLISAMAAFLAGLAALTERKGGAWLAGFATALLTIQTMALMAGHGSVHNWQSEAVFLIIMTCLFLTVVSTSRKSAEAQAEAEAEAASLEATPA